MLLTAGDIQRVHAWFGTADELVERRRAIYRSALGLARGNRSGSEPGDVPVEILDNPAVRAHLGEVLGGTARFDASRIFSVDELAIGDEVRERSSPPVRIAATTRAASALAQALNLVGAGLERPDLGADPAALLLAPAGSYDRAARVVTRGVELALDVVPELARDLLPHVGLFAVLDAAAAGRLGSASVREFPGLILLPEPHGPLEVAEALIHEGAHQKFFDLAMTAAMLGSRTSTDHFVPPWSDGASAWPFEQCVAAFHAYTCLAALHARVSARGDLPLHAHSLLPWSAERAGILADWLAARGNLLGPDGQEFVTRLGGRVFAASPAVMDASAEIGAMEGSDQLDVQRCGPWTLLMRWSQPVVVVWVRSSAEVESAADSRTSP
jgi:hypothetical protein